MPINDGHVCLYYKQILLILYLPNKDFIPLCTTCYENLSPLSFNICHMCITTSINLSTTNE